METPGGWARDQRPEAVGILGVLAGDRGEKCKLSLQRGSDRLNLNQMCTRESSAYY